MEVRAFSWWSSATLILASVFCMLGSSCVVAAGTKVLTDRVTLAGSVALMSSPEFISLQRGLERQRIDTVLSEPNSLDELLYTADVFWLNAELDAAWFAAEAVNALAAFVRRGGGLLVTSASDRESMVNDLVSAVGSDIRLAATRQGVWLAAQVMVPQWPEDLRLVLLEEIASISGIGPGVDVLLEASTPGGERLPVATLQRAGQGNLAVCAGSLLPLLHFEDAVYDNGPFTVALIGWLGTRAKETRNNLVGLSGGLGDEGHKHAICGS